MKAQYSYLKDQFKNSDKIFKGIKKLLKNPQFTFGKELEVFEKRFAKFVGAKYALGVGSGTDALKLSLKAVGVKPGDEVITTSQTFIATVGAIVEIGAKPVFVDVYEEFTMSCESLLRALSEKTKAILPVHYSGNPAYMERIMNIALFNGNIPIVEDACCAIDARIEGKHVGTFGAAGAFSLHPLKNLNVWGDGGMVVTDREDIYEQIKLLRNHGLKDRDTVEIFGHNSRLDTIQAIVGNYLLSQVKEITNKRIANAKYFDNQLAKLSQIKIPFRAHDVRHVYHMYMIYAQHRDDLLKFLNDKNIEAKIHYPTPVHLQPASKKLGLNIDPYSAKNEELWLIETDRQCKNLISLPVHQHLTKYQLKYIVESIKEFYAGKIS